MARTYGKLNFSNMALGTLTLPLSLSLSLSLLLSVCVLCPVWQHLGAWSPPPLCNKLLWQSARVFAF